MHLSLLSTPVLLKVVPLISIGCPQLIYQWMTIPLPVINGLLCRLTEYGGNLICLWNPSTRQRRMISPPSIRLHESVHIGFYLFSCFCHYYYSVLLQFAVYPQLAVTVWLLLILLLLHNTITYQFVFLNLMFDPFLIYHLSQILLSLNS